MEKEERDLNKEIGFQEDCLGIDFNRLLRGPRILTHGLVIEEESAFKAREVVAQLTSQGPLDYTTLPTQGLSLIAPKWSFDLLKAKFGESGVKFREAQPRAVCGLPVDEQARIRRRRFT